MTETVLATTPSPPESQSDRDGMAAAHRIRYLDGLRGIAVLAVAGWHYYGPTYASILPYGDAYRGLPLFGQGWFGVYLFFLISGFVIFRTLETSSGTIEFLTRRWIRLAPALLTCSLLIAMASKILPGMPDGGYRAIDIAAGLTFISPSFYHALLNVDVKAVDGAYWTLGVEFSFYLTIGFLYFFLGWKKSIAALVGLWVVSSGLRHYPISWIGRAAEPLWWAGLEHFGWFASGALFFKAHEQRSRKLYCFAVAIALTCSLTSFLVTAWLDKAALIGVVVLFATSQQSITVQRWLAARWLFFIGTISYPLYLLHNHLGLGLIAYVGDPAGRAAALMPLAVIVVLAALAYMIHAYIEPRAAAWLKRQLLKSSRPSRSAG